jgi:hypothetical protein
LSRRPVGGSTRPKSSRPRIASRKVDAAAERVTSRPIVPRKSERGQAGLFDERPKWTPPMLATPRAVAPSGPQWMHEIKWDGYRMVAIIVEALSWIKTKCMVTEIFAVIGVEPTRGPLVSLRD